MPKCERSSRLTSRMQELEPIWIDDNILISVSYEFALKTILILCSSHPSMKSAPKQKRNRYLDSMVNELQLMKDNRP
jgi:hypothetical protein